ncbi:putative transmembrane protein [Rhizoctonia solani 123E]|uniref:Putative transmembrane protein n=1 Tax=Rhizoctonia solani 123E TaxID=1423351 RepID=A0A074RLC7_9AGAM|nr:putative transmembrane protein [Rhizoctonia solani 123E]
MAQAVYDQHPLGDYLKDEAGEQAVSLCVPGGDSPVADSEEIEDIVTIAEAVEPLIRLIRHLYQSIMLLSRQTAHREFAERFTHAIILSPLLGSTGGSSPPPSLPKSQHENEQVAPIHAWPIAAAILVVAVFIASGIIPASVIALGAGVAHFTNMAPEHHARRFLAIACGKLRSTGCLSEWEDDPAPVMLAALDKCVQAASVWDTVVSEAMALLETEERNMFYASSPQSPHPSTSALRIAITSELNTATSTTDTLRSLFGPLTSPAALAPLAAMYGPPASPPPVRVRHHARYASISSGPRVLSPSPPSPVPGSKRSTWGPGITNTPSTSGKFSASGSYSHLGIGRRRTSASLRRSRFTNPNLLDDVATVESDIGGEESEKLAPLPQFNSDSEAAGPKTPPRRLLPLGSPLAFKTPERNLQVSSPSTFGSAALSTLRKSSQIQTTSLTALRHALTAARSSRRHTAAHLLALRFTDGDSEYWEDVRSVLGLLSAGLEDSASRLAGAVDTMSDVKQRLSSFGSERSVTAAITPLSAGFGFAPILRPRERFDICVKELGSAMSRANELVVSMTESSLHEDEEETKLEAIRRELGSALRQLERARAVIKSQRTKSPLQQPQLQEEDSDVPALDTSPSPTSEDLAPFRRHSLNSEKSLDERDELESAHVGPDDASAYLILGTSPASLPAPGIEQVFEADTEDAPSRVRPKSTLTRAERIAARRAAPPTPKPVDGNWEVVKELKAVISEVGGRRRKVDLGIDVRRVDVGVVVEGEEETS